MGITISSGMTETVSAGQTETGDIVESGGFLIVESGGMAGGAVVSAGGSVNVLSGGAISGATLGGVTINPGIEDKYGSLNVSSGGMAGDVTVSSDGNLDIAYGGIVSGITVEEGGTIEYVSGAALSGLITLDSGSLAVIELQSGMTLSGIISASTLLQLEVESGASASGITLENNVSLFVDSGGSVSGVIVGRGGFLDEFFGASVSGVTLEHEGTWDLPQGGSASDITLDSGSHLLVQGDDSVSGVTVSSGGKIDFLGGTANNVTVESGGLLEVASGASVTGDVLSGGAVQYLYGFQPSGVTLETGAITDITVDSGVTARNVTVESGAFLNVVSGGSASGVVVSSGGLLIADVGTSISADVQSGATVEIGYVSGSSAPSGLTIESGAIVENVILDFYQASAGEIISGVTVDGGEMDLLSGAVASNVTLTDGGYSQIYSGGLAKGVTVGGNGSEMDVDSGGMVSGVTVESGGYLYVYSGGVVSGGVAFAGAGDGELILTSGGDVSSALISGFDAGDEIDFSGESATSASYSSGTLNLTSGGGTVATVALAGNYAGATFTVSANGNGGTDLTVSNVPCFLRGTRILTPQGERPVEDLRAGDPILTRAGIVKPIAWVGFGSALVTPRTRCDVSPILIRKDAFAKGVPYRDLWVTRHHAMLVGDVLVPAEHLVNGVSILWDDETRAIDYYHIELEQHDILVAEGAPAESFRDDADSRILFHNHADRHVGGATEPCLPVVTDGPALERAWRHLASRAGKEATTDDPDLHLRVDGRRMDADFALGPVRRFRFDTPPVRSVAVLSRSTIPAGLGVNPDQRRLGVALTGLRLISQAGCEAIDVNDPRLVEGFHRREDLGYRWTAGHALLPPALFEGLAGPVELELIMGLGLRYRTVSPLRKTGRRQ